MERKQSQRLIEQTSYQALKQINTTLGEQEKITTNQNKERYRRSLEEQIASNNRFKSAHYDMSPFEKQINNNEVLVIKKAVIDPFAPIAVSLKDSPLYIPTVRQSPNPKRNIQSFKSKLPPTFFSHGTNPMSVLPPDFIGMSSDRKRR
jgi:hypothetical protein